MAALLGRGDVVKSYPFAGRWLDIGVPADYERAQEEFEQNRSRYLPDRPLSRRRSASAGRPWGASRS